MTANLLLSIIVPTYNVAPYLGRCVESLMAQNIPHNTYEIIIVNDGSTDNSLEIAQHLATVHQNIIVIDQQNRGLAGARNAGVKHAKGEFLLFVDSDDYLLPNVLQEMLAFATLHTLEIAMFSQKIIAQDKAESFFKVPSSESSVMTGMEMYQLRPGDSACKYLINTDFLKKNDLYFFEDAKFLEDGEWSPRIFSVTLRAAYKNLVFYVYELRAGSLITSNFSFSEKAVNGYINSALNIKNFQTLRELTLDQKLFLNQAIIKFAVLPFSMLASQKNFKGIGKLTKQMKESNLEKLDTRSVQGFRLTHGVLYNFSPTVLLLYLLFMNIKNAVKRKLSF